MRLSVSDTVEVLAPRSESLRSATVADRPPSLAFSVSVPRQVWRSGAPQRSRTVTRPLRAGR